MMLTNPLRIKVSTLLFSILAASAAPITYAAPPATVAKTVYAQVLKVVPLHRAVAHCPLEAKPAHTRGLMAQLRWDFDNQCALDPSASRSFMVTYTWDGRTYTEKLSYNPGKHIPLEVRYR